jgi:D-alanyl-D-alanine carboxypeptidase/D-alanyl-D-alanine-endopeptidase (penicillin-binding protein 4)
MVSNAVHSESVGISPFPRLRSHKAPFKFLHLHLWLAILLALPFPSRLYSAAMESGLEKKIGKNDAVLVADPGGKVLFSKNADRKQIPASTLKIFTSLFALEALGAGYRFHTEFYLDESSNLKIKGYGDPLLISEVIREIAHPLKRAISKYRDLILDDSFFSNPLAIPGISKSSQPYDAPNGALCVNFNTVSFKRTESGRYESAEPQTPLLPFVAERVKASGSKKDRIIFSQKGNEITLYAGHLIQYFLKEAGISGSGQIRLGKAATEKDRLIFTYRSPFSLEDIIERLMEHSNNFSANQILIASGARIFGPPGTLDKGVQAAKAFAEEALESAGFQMVEGSGISRDNRISAQTMLAVLRAFMPHHRLLRHEKGIYYKTGTLSGISTRAGYIEGQDQKLFPFAVFLNTPGRRAEDCMGDVVRVAR